MPPPCGRPRPPSDAPPSTRTHPRRAGSPSRGPSPPAPGGRPAAASALLSPRRVSIPTATRLAPQLAPADLGLQRWRGPVALVARRLVHVPAGRVGHVQARQVAEPEGTERPSEALFD